MNLFNSKQPTRIQPKNFIAQTTRIERHELEFTKQPGTKAFLSVIRSRADLGVHTFIDGPTIIGRHPNCSIPLHDFGVSRRHTSISIEGEKYILEDLESTNGTRVNGDPISKPYELKNGDKVFVGDSVLRFALADKVDIDFHSEIASLVSTDPLTGLPSKRQFDQAFEFSLEEAIQSKQPLALLMMDMDGVKQINDTHGHLFGAYVIGETGKLIARVVGSLGRACRFGGDEFSAFLPKLDLESASQLAQQIRTSVENAGFEKDGISLKPTISIGVASFPDASDQILGLIEKADKALYQAKELGKNRVAVAGDLDLGHPAQRGN